MREKIYFEIKEFNIFKSQLFDYLQNIETFAVYDSNNNADFEIPIHSRFDFIAGIDKIDEFKAPGNNIFNAFENYADETDDMLFGFFGYDLKNDIEGLKSENYDSVEMPDIYFFRPKYILKLSDNLLIIEYHTDFSIKNDAEEFLNSILNINPDIKSEKLNLEISQRVSEKEYLINVESLKNHIKRGDIYEVNYCIEFYNDNAEVNPYTLYQKLNSLSPTPFSAFIRISDKFLISSSPERFLSKKGNKIISQPIKGTIKRGKTAKEDVKLKQQLRNDIKEQAENVMIVDLVRNDLAKTAEPGSVKVEELFGIYKFRQVFQMISTVSSSFDEKIHFAEAIKTSFPPGSMTGAPKISAMKLIENYEKTKRGLYSGTAGYITAEKDFDFNVVIRSILYNASNKYLSFMVGGAITDKAVAEKEYEECLLKAKGMISILTVEEI